MFSSYQKYRKKYSRLVELERKEEIEKHEKEIRKMSPGEREAKGRAFLKMKGRDEGIGLGSYHIVRFVRGGELPDSEISVGDLLLVSKGDPLNKDNPTGTVTEKTKYSISAAFQTRPPSWVYGKGLRLDLYVNDITFQRMLEAMKILESVEGKKKRLRDIILGDGEPEFLEPSRLDLLNKELNSSQREAVEDSIAAQDLFLIHGPPGTGKTTALIEVIEQHLRQGNKVLATADSNIAVDNMVEFLSSIGRKVVRVGHPARVTESLREHNLEYLAGKREKHRRAQDLRIKASKLNQEQENYPLPSKGLRRGLSNEAIKNLAKKGQGSRGIPPGKIKKVAKWIELQEEISSLIEKAEKLEDEVVNEIISESDVVCATNSMTGSELLRYTEFDVAVIDEATQATEPSCLIPMVHANKLIMAGDHKQLPPTILNQEAKEKGLEKTLFERMLEVHGYGIRKMLRTQYRMNAVIMDFSCQKFYSCQLEAAEGVADHKLSVHVDDLEPQWREICDPYNPIVLVDTEGVYEEKVAKGSTSRHNPGEATIVQNIVKKLVDLDVDPHSIGVISPYYDQIDLLLKNIRHEGLEIKTVDGFQGREKDVILLSLVRSNQRGDIGFLEDERRLNVSITRPRKKLVIVGDSKTLSANHTYRDMVDYIFRKGKYLTLSTNRSVLGSG
ncbi:MAG: IGHMBP2 family helicase [Archaeoglobaceae archaeon]